MAKKTKKRSINMQADDQITVGLQSFWFPDYGRVLAANAQEAAKIVQSKKS